MARDEQTGTEMQYAPPPAGVDADTHIYVNQPTPRPASPPPAPPTPQAPPAAAPTIVLPVSPNVSQASPATPTPPTQLINQLQQQPPASYGGERQSGGAGQQAPSAPPAAGGSNSAPVYQTFIGAAPQSATAPAGAGTEAGRYDAAGNARLSAEALEKRDSSITTRTQNDSATYAPDSLTRRTTTQQFVTRTHSLDGPRTVKHTGVNWGTVVKGVAIIAAVAVAGVAVYAGISALSGAALSSPAVSGVVGTVADMAAPVVDAATYGVEWLQGFLPHVPGAISGFFRETFGMAASSAAASSGTAAAAAAPLSGSTVSGISKFLGLLGGSGAAAWLASHQVGHANLLTHSETTITPSDQVHYETIVQTAPEHFVAGQPAHHAHNDTHHAAEAALHSYEFGHQANHGPASHAARAGDGVSADVDSSASVDVDSSASVDVDSSASEADSGPQDDLLRRRENRSWRSRAAANSFADTAKVNGYRAALDATRSEQAPRQRLGDYAGSVAEDRAENQVLSV